MGRLAWAAALAAAGCGNATGPTAPDAEIRALDSIQVTGKAKLSWTLTTKLTATAMFSNNKTLDITPNVTWSSSSDAIATVAADGTVTAVAEGDAMIKASYEGQDSSFAFHVSMPTIAASAIATKIINFYPANAMGNIAPTRSISGASTALNRPWGMAVHGNELFVADQGVNAILVYPLDGTGNIAPTREIMGALTTMGSPDSVFVTDTEIIVADEIKGVMTFPINGTGNIAPSRIITNADISSGIGVFVKDNEMFISSFSPGQIVVVAADAANPNTTTLRKITGSSTLLSNGRNIALNPQGEIVESGEERIIVYDRNANGNTPPLRYIAGTTSKVDREDQSVFLGNRMYIGSCGSAVNIYDINASGDTAPMAQLIGAATLLSSCTGLVMFGVDE